MIELIYFARLREVLGREREAAEVPPGVDTVGAIRAWLGERGGPWLHELADNPALCIAVNREYAGDGDAIRDGDEIAFFPPVAGG